MNPNEENKLESLIDREMKLLPHVSAPTSLALRVMAAIERRAHLPWYRRSWQFWPRPIQLSSVAAAMAVFALACYGTWLFRQSVPYASAHQDVHSWFSGLGALANAFYTLFGALVISIKKLGTGFLIGCACAIAFGYVMCLGLGTVCFRLALARR
jgi:hypothetical protein